MPDAVRRGLRTFAQAGGAAILVTAFALFVRPLTVEQQAAAIAVIGLLAAVTMNALEDAGAIPAFGKAPPSPGANPVPEPDKPLERH